MGVKRWRSGGCDVARHTVRAVGSEQGGLRGRTAERARALLPGLNRICDLILFLCATAP